MDKDMVLGLLRFWAACFAAGLLCILLYTLVTS